MRNTVILFYSFARNKALPAPISGVDTEYPALGWALVSPTQEQIAILVDSGVSARQVVVVQS